MTQNQPQNEPQARNRVGPEPRRAQHTRAERIVIYALTGLTLVILTAGLVNQLGLIIGNPTRSVPPGLYRIAAPDKADHVTFCLGTRHRGKPFYPLYCSPDAPGYIRILKRISEQHPDGSLTVEGDTPDALDSRLLGPIRHQEIRGWWVPLITERPPHITSRETKS